MKKLIVPFAIFISVVLSSCTIAQYTFIRNLSEDKAEVYFDFDLMKMNSLPDSIHVPFSAMSHPVNSKSVQFFKDSIAAKRYTSSTMVISIPAGGMIMFDKTTLKKFGFMAPEKVKIALPGKEPYTVRLVAPAQSGEKLFQTKGNSPKIYWHDIY